MSEHLNERWRELAAQGRPTTNGNLPEHRQKQVEAGLAQYQMVLAERDELQRKLKDATVQLEAQDVKLEALQGVINLMESTVQTCQVQRDDAVIEATRLRTVLNNALMLLTSEAKDNAENDLPPHIG